MTTRLWRWIVPLFGFLLAAPANAGTFDVLRYDEATIADIQAAFKAKTLTCRGLVQMYLDRIDAYDRKGPALNAIVVTNPDALKVADALDAKFVQSGPIGPLHCVPLIVKDNYETTDMPTSAGSLSLKGVMSRTDAFQIKKLHEAGAIMLAKSNMGEFAFDPMETVNSLLPGYTRNPYALDRVTAGSSGGTAAAVAANFGVVGLGTDTGNSIRGPASHTSLVGIRSTMGLTSRDGIVPLFLDKDIGGPLARNVADAVAIFDVISGYDPADPVTAASQGKRADSYVVFLDKDGVRGKRLGVVRQLFTPQNTDPEVMKRMEQALVDLGHLGAQIVDPVHHRRDRHDPAGHAFLLPVQVRHQRVPAATRPRRTGQDTGRHHQVWEVPSIETPSRSIPTPRVPSIRSTLPGAIRRSAETTGHAREDAGRSFGLSCRDVLRPVEGVHVDAERVLAHRLDGARRRDHDGEEARLDCVGSKPEFARRTEISARRRRSPRGHGHAGPAGGGVR